MKRNVQTQTRAFTLIELMVVIAIIGLLVGLLLPAIKAATNAAKVTATRATFQAIDTALEAFKGHSALGGTYPPSGSDSPAPYSQIMDPAVGATGRILAGGANLLVFALQGADALGTTGFIDLPASSGSPGANNGLWWDDVTVAYDVAFGNPVETRYDPFAGDDLQEKVSTINQMFTEGTIVQTGSGSVDDAGDLPFYVDAFDRPILYYRARRAAPMMVTNPGSEIGIYDQRDNQAFTGALDGSVGIGLDFGAGTAHEISRSLYPSIDPAVSDLGSGNYGTGASGTGTFEQFIWDASVTARNVPNRRETYLLISAGPDAIYGNGDDVTNWSRE